MGNLLNKLKKEKNNNSIENQNNSNNIKDEDNSNIRNYKNNEVYLSPRKLWRPPTPPKKTLNNIK